MGEKRRHVLIDKTGREIFSANSFLGFIGMLLGTVLFAFIIIMIIAGIFCGIGSLFK